MKTRLLLIFTYCIGCVIGYAQVDEVVPFTSSNLPIIVINTHGAVIQDDPKIAADMGIIHNDVGRNNMTDPFNDFSGTIGIEIRGSSSQMFPKKQFGIELWDASGIGVSASLLGMPSEEDWILFAPYDDKSLMRDALAYKLGRDLGDYAPRTRYCEVVINDVYQGVYVLIEKIKRNKNRVDVAKLTPDEITGDDLTGGYIFKIDKATGSGGDGWSSDYPPPNNNQREVFFQYDYPKPENIAPEQKAYIRELMKKFEQVLKSPAFADPVNGYAKYIDVDSYVDFFIMQEITKNVDGYRLSTYLHKDKDSDGGKLAMGPIWDFNLGFGNADYCTSGNPEGFVLDFNDLCAGDYWLIPFWWKRLLQDNAFRAKVATRWAELRSTKFQKQTILAHIDSIAGVLNAESQQRNFIAWKVLNKYVWPNYYVGATFKAEVDWLKGWVSNRLDWLDGNLPSLVTSTESHWSQPSVSVFPNPFSTQVNFEYEIEKPGTVTLRIFDGLGRTIHTAELHPDTVGRHAYTWGTDQAAGLFFFKLEQNSFVLGDGKFNKQ